MLYLDFLYEDLLNIIIKKLDYNSIHNLTKVLHKDNVKIIKRINTEMKYELLFKREYPRLYKEIKDFFNIQLYNKLWENIFNDMNIFINNWRNTSVDNKLYYLSSEHDIYYNNRLVSTKDINKSISTDDIKIKHIIRSPLNNYPSVLVEAALYSKYPKIYEIASKSITNIDQYRDIFIFFIIAYKSYKKNKKHDLFESLWYRIYINNTKSSKPLSPLEFTSLIYLIIERSHIDIPSNIHELIKDY